MENEFYSLNTLISEDLDTFLNDDMMQPTLLMTKNFNGSLSYSMTHIPEANAFTSRSNLEFLDRCQNPEKKSRKKVLRTPSTIQKTDKRSTQDSENSNIRRHYSLKIKNLQFEIGNQESFSNKPFKIKAKAVCKNKENDKNKMNVTRKNKMERMMNEPKVFDWSVLLQQELIKKTLGNQKIQKKESFSKIQLGPEGLKKSILLKQSNIFKKVEQKPVSSTLRLNRRILMKENTFKQIL